MSYAAEYNLHDDRLKWFIQDGPRLGREKFLEAKRIMGAYWRGSGCLTGVWTPAREDFVLSMLGNDQEIEMVIDDDSGYSYRVERFERYSDSAAKRSEEAYQRSRDAVDGIPFGQPILVGHHSEGRHRAAINRSHRAMDRSVYEQRKAAYWAERQEAAERHAAYKERPDVIARRIERYETDLRQVERRNDGSEFDRRWIEHYRMVLDYQRELYKRSGGVEAENNKPQVGGAIGYWGGIGPVIAVNGKSVTTLRTFSNSDTPDSAFREVVTLDKVTKVFSPEDLAKVASAAAYCQALIAAHNKQFETKTEVKPEKGGALKYRRWYGRDPVGWCEILRVNQRSITVQVPGYRTPDKAEKADVTEVLSPADWAAEKAKRAESN